jgi:protein gp37
MHSESVFEPILKWPRSPRMAFLDSMSDVFHARVWADFLGRVFATMALTPQHTYQILTKRPNRMRELLTNGRVHAAMRTALVDVSISDRCKLARRDNQLDASPGGHMSMAVAECVAGNVDRV